ncbi:MAG TPA: NAD(P)-dependent oxidoreductase [Rhizomicrobium sp.]|jgi:phosphoglycerate dehydrogenase-like enzyme/predicted dehydrogenase
MSPARPKTARALVIGAGPAAFSMHLPVLARLRDRGEIVLAAICDIREDRAALACRKFDFLQRTGDAAAALTRSDIDVVYIFADATLHHQYGLRALHAGKHLFVEKPIAPSFTEACEMADLARSMGLVAVGGHNRRFFPALVEARRSAGSAGWNSADARFHKNELGNSPPFGAKSWLSANGIHALDALIFMMGGLPGHLVSQAEGVSDFSALMRWTSGASAVFLSNNRAGARREQYVFHAPGLSCHVEETRLVIEKNGAASNKTFRADHDGLLAEHAAFLSAIRDGSEPDHVLARLAPSLFLAERIEESFCGRLYLPMQRMSPKAPPPPHKVVLIVEGEGLLGPAARLAKEFSLVSLEEVARSSSPRLDIVAALLGHRASALPAEVLNKLPNLRVVGFAGLSLSHLEPDTLLDRGIALMHASQAYAESVAELALGLAILGRRRAFLSHKIMRAGGWGTDPAALGLTGSVRRARRGLRPLLSAFGLEPLAMQAWRKTKPFLGHSSPGTGQVHDLNGATAGLIGWGANAQAFAKRLGAAGVRVLAWSEHGKIDGEASAVSLADALSADLVSLHRGLTPATRHFLGAAELARLKPGAVLINVARGALIEPGALVDRLRQGDIFACLDTYEEEPLAAEHPLRQLPNVFLTPHIAGGAPEMHAAAAEEIVAKVAAYLRGDSAETIPAGRLATMT